MKNSLTIILLIQIIFCASTKILEIIEESNDVAQAVNGIIERFYVAQSKAFDVICFANDKIIFNDITTAIRKQHSGIPI